MFNHRGKRTQKLNPCTKPKPSNENGIDRKINQKHFRLLFLRLLVQCTTIRHVHCVQFKMTEQPFSPIPNCNSTAFGGFFVGLSFAVINIIIAIFIMYRHFRFYNYTKKTILFHVVRQHTYFVT